MIDAAELCAVKRRLAFRLLGMDGVTGMSVREGRLIVYLDSPREATREEVTALIEAEAPATPLEYVVTGAFLKLTDEREEVL